MRVYISGPITDNPDYMRQFSERENELKQMGYDTCNPTKYAQKLRDKYRREPTWDEYMEFDIALLTDCDAISMLPGWENSRGAKVEHDFAVRTNKALIEVSSVNRKW